MFYSTCIENKRFYDQFVVTHNQPSSPPVSHRLLILPQGCWGNIVRQVLDYLGRQFACCQTMPISFYLTQHLALDAHQAITTRGNVERFIAKEMRLFCKTHGCVYSPQLAKAIHTGCYERTQLVLAEFLEELQQQVQTASKLNQEERRWGPQAEHMLRDHYANTLYEGPRNAPVSIEQLEAVIRSWRGQPEHTLAQAKTDLEERLRQVWKNHFITLIDDLRTHLPSEQDSSWHAYCFSHNNEKISFDPCYAQDPTWHHVELVFDTENRHIVPTEATAHNFNWLLDAFTTQLEHHCEQQAGDLTAALIQLQLAVEDAAAPILR